MPYSINFRRCYLLSQITRPMLLAEGTISCAASLIVYIVLNLYPMYTGTPWSADLIGSYHAFGGWDSAKSNPRSCFCSRLESPSRVPMKAPYVFDSSRPGAFQHGLAPHNSCRGQSSTLRHWTTGPCLKRYRGALFKRHKPHINEINGFLVMHIGLHALGFIAMPDAAKTISLGSLALRPHLVTWRSNSFMGASSLSPPAMSHFGGLCTIPWVRLNAQHSYYTSSKRLFGSLP